jgi:hypothetical protein
MRPIGKRQGFIGRDGRVDFAHNDRHLKRRDCAGARRKRFYAAWGFFEDGAYLQASAVSVLISAHAGSVLARIDLLARV